MPRNSNSRNRRGTDAGNNVIFSREDNGFQSKISRACDLQQRASDDSFDVKQHRAASDDIDSLHGTNGTQLGRNNGEQPIRKPIVKTR